MSTAQSFLNAAIAAPAEQKGSDFGFETIAKIETHFGLHCFIGSDYSKNEFFPYPDMEDDTRQRVLGTAKHHIKVFGGSKDVPSEAIQITIFGDEVLTAKDGSWASNWVEHIVAYASKTNVSNDGKVRALSKLDPEVQEKLAGKDLLYDIVMNGLVATGGQTFNKPMWAKIKEVVDPIVYAKDQRDRPYTNKEGEEKMAFKTRRVKIMEVYPNKTTAQHAANEILAGFSDSPSTPTPSLSATAVAANWTLEGLQAEAEKFHSKIAGKPIKIIDDLLREWSLERSDLLLMNIEIAF